MPRKFTTKSRKIRLIATVFITECTYIGCVDCRIGVQLGGLWVSRGTVAYQPETRASEVP